MTRGFSVNVQVSEPSTLTPDAIRSEALGTRRLTALESVEFVNATVAAAQAILGAMPGGPFLVTLAGSDRSDEPGEETTMLVHVRALTPVRAAASTTSAPAVGTAPPAASSVETVPEPEPVEVSPQPTPEPSPEVLPEGSDPTLPEAA